MEHALSSLTVWESFYVIVGSSAAALTGLQFVVIVLAAETNTLRIPTTSAFATPTVVHFCAALLISAIMSAPWQGLSSVGFLMGACGVAGLGYVVMVVRQLRRQTDYVPVLEDWIWHCALPFVSYAALLSAPIVLQRHPRASLFMIGATALLLLFVGIHNAWDSVTYIAIQRSGKDHKTARGDQ